MSFVFSVLLVLFCLAIAPSAAVAQSTGPGFERYLERIEASHVVPGADRLGPVQDTPRAAPAYSDSQVIGNRSKGNHVGWAIMFSDNLEIRDNVSIDDRDHGLMLNTTNRSEITGNTVRGGGEKCLFMYNANQNVLADNRFESCPIGIHFTAGSEGNFVTGNGFIANRTQVKCVGTRYLDWAHEGRGNYWSDNPAFDLDGDGIAERPYRPNDVMDEVLWTLLQAKILTNSPAVQIVRWSQSRFPSLFPGGVVDTAP